MLSLRRLLLGSADASRTEVRPLRREDREDVLRIESASFPDAWSARDLDHFLGKGCASAHVLWRGGRRVGFFLVIREHDQLHLANIAVAPEVRRTGIATLALQAVEDLARAGGLPRVVLEVRETNLPAQLLYRRCGYRAVEILRGHYGDQDAYRMTKDVATPRAALP